MLLEILNKLTEENLLSGVEVGEIIRPIDVYKTSNVFCDQQAEKPCGKPYRFTNKDIFEVQVVTPNEFVAYVKTQGVFVVVDMNDLSEFQPAE